ncbi:S-adenosyl-L-methionine-dependent methyltransferase [Phlyctochytrium arcticum]|nr:S-adenosyl-L-methionine-dependent methyltransferase [Phlyctochytrium arcticum]
MQKHVGEFFLKKRTIFPDLPAMRLLVPRPASRCFRSLLTHASRPPLISRSFRTWAPLRANYWDSLHKRSQGQTKVPPPASSHHEYKRLTTQDAALLSSPPTKARMLVRDFIDDSLYNPNYGYFSKKAYIFSPEGSIPFNDIRDNYAFMNHLSGLYKEVEGEYNEVNDIARQVWHTPTELFKPWYGFALAKYMVSEYKRDSRGNDELVIYEVGAGNGTLMVNILDYIKQFEPELYKRTKYRIIEISSKLAERQSERQDVVQVSKRHDCVEIINQSIFTWSEHVPDSCFIVAMEVIDNFSHDLVRYDYQSGEARQGVVLIDEDGDYQEAYEPVSDPHIMRYLELREETGYVSPLLSHPWKRRARSLLPFAPNMTDPEFLPTMCMRLFDQLNSHFPKHRLVISDFDALPDAVKGISAPVVQTRYQGMMIPCSTYLVQPGWFDIFFPTNFELMLDMYDLICTSSRTTDKSTARAATIMTQREFLEQNADLEATRTKSGENPMLNFYQNFKFFLS